MDQAVPPVGDDETIYRRVVYLWLRQSVAPPQIDVQAFMPRPSGDDDGLSVSRALYKAAEEVANHPLRKYHVAQLTAGGVKALRLARDAGLRLSVVADPQQDDEGHALIPEMTSDARKTAKEATTEWAVALSSLATIAFVADA